MQRSALHPQPLTNRDVFLQIKSIGEFWRLSTENVACLAKKFGQRRL
jgi:hypothetical protein